MRGLKSPPIAAVLFLFAGLPLASCAPSVVSHEGLLADSSERLSPGLWAVLEPGCARPARGAATTDWPDCAYPLRVSADAAVVRFSTYPEAAYVLDRGAPSLVQIHPRAAGGAVEDFHYLTVEPTAGSRDPRADQRVWLVTCDDTPEAAAAGQCVVADLAALKRRAERSRRAPALLATWIRDDRS